MKKINILLSTYNSSVYLCDQLDSIIAQTYNDWSILIRDDGSKNNTIKIISSYIDKYPENIFLIESDTKNIGPCQSYAKLLEFAKADYIMFADQDDIWVPEKIEICMQHMNEMEKQTSKSYPLLVHTDLKVVDENRQVLCDSFMLYQNIKGNRDKINQLLLQNSITGCTMMMNKALKDIAMPIPNRARMHDWWIGLVASLFGKIRFINIPTVYYRQHSGNFIGAKKNDMTFIISKVKNFYQIKQELKRAISQSIELNERYGLEFNSDQKEMMNSFSNILHNGSAKRRYILLKYKIFKIGVLRNVGLFLLI